VTYSIVALDERTGELGVAVQTRWLAVGALVPWLRPGVGAIATQSFVDTRYGFSGIELLAAGRSPADALAELLAADRDPGVRQVGMVDAAGRTACETLDQQEFEGRRLTVNEAKPQERRTGGYAGGGGDSRQRRDARW